jgi:hypothetical protein
MTGRDAHARDWDWQFGMGVAGGWLRDLPDMQTSAVSLDSRRIGDGALRSRGGVAMYGVGADVDLTVDDRWRVPIGGVNVWWPIGSYDSVNTSFDGSIAHEKPWTTTRVDLLFPGFGRRVKLRRNMVSFAIRTGASRIGMDGTVAAGPGLTDIELSRWTFLAQIEVEGCRRLDPTFRVCLQVVPRVYEHTLLNGLSIGFRMEWGR